MPRPAAEHPLSRTQSLIWASQRLAPGVPLANMGKIHRVTGRLDADRLAAAFERVVVGSDALRTVVVDRPGSTPFARVLARPPAPTTRLDLPADDLDAWCAERIARPIDATSCVYDSVLLRHGDADSTWWLALHHVAIDAFGAALVFDRTAAEYARPETDDEPSWPSFYDHVAAQRERADDGRAHERAGFWAAQAGDPDPIAPYGPRGPRTTATTRRALPVTGDIDASLGADYRTLSRELSLLALAGTAAATTLARLDGRQSIVLGIPIHHRSGRTAPHVIGPLMEVFALRVEIAPGETFAERFARVSRGVMGVLRNARVGESPDLRIDVVVNVLTARFGDFAGLATETGWARSDHVDPSHPVRIQIYDYGDGLRLELDVNDALSADAAHDRLADHLARMIDAAVTDPDRSCDRAELLGADELHLLATLNPPAPGGPPLRPVHEAIAERWRATPDAITAEHHATALTGGELDRRADAVAAWLRSAGVGPASRVGLRMPRSLDVLVALHATLRCGASFVILDPDDPPARHAAIRADADLHLIVDALSDLDADSGQASAAPVTPVSLDDEAYVLYTSGSTGTPKGVPISHRGLADYLRFAVDAYADRPVVMPLHSSLVFDLTITSLFLPQLTGGRTVVIGGDPLTALEAVAGRHDLTVLKATPGQLELLTRMIDEPLGLDSVIVGGEAFRTPVAAAFAAKCVAATRIFNEYGPTEAVVGCMIHEWHPGRDTGPDVPIGTACPGAEVHVLDPAGRPTAVGAWGELYVRRPGMATGYLGLPVLSAERFVALSPGPGPTLYRTGDRVRLERGALVYGGRTDDQLKIGGVRIEPGEVEAALVQHPAITNAIVRVWEPGSVRRRQCLRCGLGTDVPELTIDADGVCSTCRTFDAVAPQAEAWFRTEADLDAIRNDARRRAAGEFDCLHLLSGGKDSTYALYQLVERGWRVHALTLDNGYISDGAKANIARSVADLGISHEFATTPAMAEIFRDSLDRFANVCNGCYKTIYTLATARAHELGIPVIVTGLSRGQFFETRLVPHQFESGRFDPDAIDRTVLEARRAYHRTRDAVTELLPEQSVFDRGDLAVLDEIDYVDFYRYVDVALSDMYDFLEHRAPWVRPADTGRSTNCLINVAGIHVHRTERGYHNYAEPYSWDVRLGHKTRDDALDELDDEIDPDEVDRMLAEVGYRPKRTELLTAWYQTLDDEPLDAAELRAQLGELLPNRSIPAAYVHVTELPLADSAKIDTAALPAPTRTHTGTADYVAPTTPTEAACADVWATVLDLDRVGIGDDFFDLGGSSLPALELIAAVEEFAGVELPDALVFSHRTLREFAAAVDSHVDGGAALEPIPPLDGDRRPLSPGEAAMLFEYRSDPTDTRYNVTRLYTIDDDLDDDRIRAALHTVVARHQPLHTSFAASRAVLAADVACSIEAMPDEPPDGFAQRQRRVRFDLDAGPLVRVHVGRREPGVTHLLIAMHHLSVDAGTFDAFWSEFDLAYHGRPLPELATTIAAHGEWQRSRWDAAATYWDSAADRTGRAGGATLPIPADHEADGYLEIEAPIATSELVAGAATTPFAASLAAASAVLGAYSRSGTVELGITASTKDHHDAEPLVGYFLNTLPLLVEVDLDGTLRALDSRAGEIVAEALPHRTMPLAEIVERGRRAGRAAPDVRHMLAYERLAPATWGDGGTARHRILASGTSVSELTLFVQERGDELHLGVEYRGTSIGRRDAARLLDAFAAALAAIARRPHHRVRDLTDALAGRDLTGPTLADHPESVVHSIADRVVALPDATAVIAPLGVTLSYGELWRRAGVIAHRVHAVGGVVGDVVERPRRVGVAVGRTADMIAAIVGVLRSGAAYVPLDPTVPRSRLDRIVAASGLDAVVVDGHTATWFDPIPTVQLDSDDTASTDEPTVRLPSADDDAYVVFTSGSTGEPAGVAVSHRNLAASNAARAAFYGAEPPARFLLTSSIGFDSSIVGLFWPLTTGGAIVVASDDDVHDVDRLAAAIESAEATHLLMVPSLYRAMLARRAGLLGSLRCAIVAGESCPAELVDVHAQALPTTELVNEYGPTETTVWATAHRCTSDRRPVPIGRPIAGATVRVADDRLRAIAIGASGELLISGPGVTAGYTSARGEGAGDRRGADGATRFVTIDGDRWYRTGDLVRVDPDGDLVFVGRIDEQLNVGGVRVEPAEIERRIVEVAGADEAVVVAADVAGRETLVAHVLGDPDRIDPDEIRTRLAEVLLAGAIPRIVQVHRALPRTANGKVDRAAVALSASAAPPPGGADPAAEEGSDAVVAIWRAALRRADLDDRADFFALGGDSLAAVEIVTALGELTGRDVAVATLLAAPTPAEMTSSLELDPVAGGGDLEAGVRMVTLRPGQPDGPVVVLVSAWDDIQGYRAYADALPDAATALGVAVVGDDPAYDEVDTVVSDAIDALDTVDGGVRTRAPIAVVGWSIGGVVAFDLGHRMRAAGFAVDAIDLIDTFFPGEQRHLWSNRWWKYKSMLRPGSFTSAIDELRITAKRRSRGLAAQVARRIGAGARAAGGRAAGGVADGARAGAGAARATPGGIPFAALDHRPTQGDTPVTLFAATTTNPARTIVPWQRVVPDLRVVRLEGRHRGHDSIMGADRVGRIIDDLMHRLDR